MLARPSISMREEYMLRKRFEKCETNTLSLSAGFCLRQTRANVLIAILKRIRALRAEVHP